VNVALRGTEFGTATGFIGKMGKWNWLLVSVYKFDSLICISTDILSCWQNGVNLVMCWGGGGVVL
jgi:hypothetical protein